MKEGRESSPEPQGFAWSGGSRCGDVEWLRLEGGLGQDLSLSSNLLKLQPFPSQLRPSLGCCLLQAPFPNGGFVNGFSSPGSYKANAAALSLGRPFHRTR